VKTEHRGMLFERSSTPMVLVDDERRYRDCNSAACEALAATREELLTMRLDDRMPPERLPGLDERWERFLKLRTYSGPSSFLTRDGRVVEAHQSSTPNVLPGLHFLVFTPAGEQAILDEVVEKADAKSDAETGSLTRREREVLTLLARGLTGAQIAERLSLSPETVRIHVRNARGRLGARTRAHAIALALLRGEIEVGPFDAACTPHA
jgi:PAS domain S-box-containing protein